MYRPTYMSIKIDDTKVDSLCKTIEHMYEVMKKYNKEVEKSNRLLREQEKLRRELGIKVSKGKTYGLAEDNRKKKE